MTNKKRTILKCAMIGVGAALGVIVLSLQISIQLYQGELKLSINELKNDLDVAQNDIYILSNDIKSMQEDSLRTTLDSVQETDYQDLTSTREFEALVNATFRIETGHGTSSLWLNSNNAGGIKCGVEYCEYQTPQDGMNDLRTLLQSYVERFGYDLKAIRDLYCQCGYGDLETFTEIYNNELGGGYE
ncbi:glucosaminidase domain-containing protein [Erysipelothrix sp. HDW6C]|uniref:glucosaminidase domain-containing protein n=1 Tax=Erysipelothrix sp. HDW6C TaxID=2714930 RepID=UPI00140B409F|nr:glucosaminidase domain-containing protein [Erysipelothrix sp. HDW6C]QIK68763.1 glucosaminidase domain-containing protein [Erysipelothrix sp. HDW6C]